MRLTALTTTALLVAFSFSPLAAQDCDSIAVQNLNSRAESKILILETSDTVDEMRDELDAIRANFREANAMLSQAMESDDQKKIKELCTVFEDINKQLEALEN